MNDVRTQLQNYIDMLLRANIDFTVETVNVLGKKITHSDGTTTMMFFFNSVGDLDHIETDE